MTRRSGGSPAAVLVGGLLLVGLVILVVKWLLITAAVLALPFGVWFAYDRASRHRARRDTEALVARRHEIESRAVLDAAGGCGWCGMAAGHRDHRTGASISPRAYHRYEIDQTLAQLPV